MAVDSLATSGSSRWPHRWAVVTVCAAVPLLLLGAEVTTKDVGMTDPKGFHLPWVLVSYLINVARDGGPVELGKVIEYSHRLAGFLVGIFAIVLAVELWFLEKRLWLRWLGLAALAAVGGQGILGIFRVDKNAIMGRELALVHGCFAQLVFALLVTVAVFTSRGWSTPVESAGHGPEALRLRRWALVTVCLVFLQVVLGGVVRHRDIAFGARLHLLVAFAVVAAVAWQIKLALDVQPRSRALTTSVAVLAGLIVVQLLLGVESWMSRFPSPLYHQVQPLPVHPELFRSLHYFAGSLVFATSVTVALHACRAATAAEQTHAAPVGRLEGAL
jgi:cytochrome c oxidase assembly protein subunit 15